VRLAYADPPYIGQAKIHYNSHEVNHLELLRCLATYDGWALSCSSPTVRQILELETCPKDVRIAVWVKPFCSFKPNVNPAYAWEPVLFVPARARGREKPTIPDFIIANITLQRGLAGAKPEQFCMWVFEILGAEPNDDLEDLFPGTGAVTRAWHKWKTQSQMVMPLEV